MDAKAYFPPLNIFCFCVWKDMCHNIVNLNINIRLLNMNINIQEMNILNILNISQYSAFAPRVGLLTVSPDFCPREHDPTRRKGPRAAPHPGCRPMTLPKDCVLGIPKGIFRKGGHMLSCATLMLAWGFPVRHLEYGVGQPCKKLLFQKRGCLPSCAS